MCIIMSLFVWSNNLVKTLSWALSETKYIRSVDLSVLLICFLQLVRCVPVRRNLIASFKSAQVLQHPWIFVHRWNTVVSHRAGQIFWQIWSIEPWILHTEELVLIVRCWLFFVRNFHLFDKKKQKPLLETQLYIEQLVFVVRSACAACIIVTYSYLCILILRRIQQCCSQPFVIY